MKLRNLLALAAIAVGSSAWAQTDVTSTYLENAGFDDGGFISAGVCTYAKDVAGNGADGSSLMEVPNWTAGDSGDAKAGAAFEFGSNAFLTGTDFKVPATNSEGTSTGGALGLGGCWDGNAFYTQDLKQNLVPGNYKIEICAYNAGSKTDFGNQTFGIKEANGATHYAKTTWATGKWTTATVSFEITEETAATFYLGATKVGGGSANSAKLFVDYVKITVITALDKAKDEAKAALPAPTSALFGLTAEQLAEYESQIDAATSVAEVEAIMEEVNGYNAPAFSGSWNIKNVSAGIYMGNAVLTATPIATTFEKAANGVYIKVGENYINMAGNNNWSMSASAEAKTAWTFTLTDGKYTIAGPNGLIGSDATADGSALYGNKGTGNNGYWTIDEAISEDEIALVAAKNNLRNIIDNKPTPTANIYGQSDNFVTWASSIVEAIISQKAEAEDLIANSTDIEAIENAAFFLDGIPYMTSAPEFDTPLNVIMAKEGLGWTGNAVTFTYSEGNQNKYAMAYSEVAGESNFNQTVYFGEVENEALVNMYIIDAEGKKWYVTDGTHVGSTVAWAGSQLRMTDVAEDAMPININPSLDKEGVCELINKWTGEHIGSTNNNGFYCSNDNYELAIKPAANKEIEIKVAEYGTVILPTDVDNVFISAKFYSVNSLDGNMLELSEEGDVLKANTPYIVENQNSLDDTSISIGCRANAFKTSYTDGLLTGVFADTKAPQGSYVLQNQDDKVAFYLVDSDITVPAGKAYLTAPASDAKALNFPSATAISAIEALTSGKAEIYSANGAKQDKLAKGVNILNVNGKTVKVLVK